MVSQNFRRGLILFIFLLFPVLLNYMSPYLMIQGAAEKVLTASVIFWGLFFLTSIFVGRAGCAYICPFGGFQTMLHRVVDIKPKDLKYSKYFKYAFWAAWMGAYFLVLLKAGGYSSINLMYSTENFFSVDSVRGLLMYYSLVVLVAIFVFIFGKMGFCKSVCPFSVFNIIGTKLNKALRLPTFYLELDKSACTKCGKCSKACPMGIKMPEMAEGKQADNIDCILCAECCSACSKRALKRNYGIQRKLKCETAKDVSA